MRDIIAWANTRRMTPKQAALQLVRIGLDATSEETEAAVEAGLDVINRVKARAR